MIKKIKIPHTCGEWLQGSFSGEDFLISCPISDYSVVTVNILKSNTLTTQINGIRKVNDVPIEVPWKVIQAIELVIDYLKLPSMHIEITIDTKLPGKKGYGTSSADIYGGILGLCQLYLQDSKLNHLNLAIDIATKVEPSDSTCCPGISKLNHITGENRRKLGNCPSGNIAVIDLGGFIDTKEFNENRKSKQLNQLKEPMLSNAYRTFLKGIQTKDLSLMANASTISARLHQQTIYKEEIDFILESFNKAKALGVVRAHSGTVVGLVYPKGTHYKKSFKEWYNKYQIGNFVGFYSTVNGGMREVL
ncbi:hypothetical protein [Natranaerobius trueperi]|uniref:GHMP kinase N-terminal domain-containing protein n=1 Tax=Natranaerobius trueperi TaxID=759412 RepID=A0A226BVE0_9FIRM|nr:hypothetical protein [Natranaerobius trueperi]OWZ82966.1 hypothetical protein CDO51_11065 [Natranaerobius trueperi]